MKYINFKGTKISKLSLGSAQFGLNYGISNEVGKVNKNDTSKIIDFAHKSGINCIDTAYAYGNTFNSDTFNNKILIISKVSTELFLDVFNYITTPIYALLLHDSKLLSNWSKKYDDIVMELIKLGLIKHFGISIYDNSEFSKAMSINSIDFIQIPFNVFDLRAIKMNWFNQARDNDKLLFVRSIFLQGLLLMDKDKIPLKLEKAKKYISFLNDFSDELNISPSLLTISFVRNYAKDDVLIFGCESITQAKDNIKNFNTSYHIPNKDEIISRFKNIDESIYHPIRW